MADAPNPFELYDIDPTKGPEAITERLRELTDAADDQEREVLRAVWERLTMHPRKRLRIALAAFPETRPPIGAPPAASAAFAEDDTLHPLELRDLALLPSVAGALSPQPAELPPTLPPLTADPNLDDAS